MTMIGEMVPAFHGTTTSGEIDFPKDYYGTWIILFSYIGDYTPVCTTELMTFASMINEFKELNTQLIGLSGDSLYTHIAWLRKIRELAWKDMKRIEVNFPLISDGTYSIAKTYGMLRTSCECNQLARSVYIVDPEGRLRTELHYPSEMGRNIKELKRILQALQKADQEHALIPAQWTPQEDVILEVPDTCTAACDRIEKVNRNTYCLDWFLSFKQSNCTMDEEHLEPEINPFPSAVAMKRKADFHI